MKPLEITDNSGDIIHATTDVLGFDRKEKTVYITIRGSEQSRDDAQCVEITKSQAIQIIEHLKQCFEL